MNIVAVCGDYALVEACHAGSDTDAQPALQTLCDPLLPITAGPIFVVNGCLRSIDYNGVYCDTTQVNVVSTHGIDVTGHTAPGKPALLSAAMPHPWAFRYTEAVKTAEKCMADDRWQAGIVLIDVPSDVDWGLALQAIADCPVPSTTDTTKPTVVLMRDDQPRMMQFSRDAPQEGSARVGCFMLSDRMVYDFTKQMFPAVASPLLPHAPENANALQSLTSTFMRKLLGTKSPPLAARDVFNHTCTHGTVVQCADSVPMACVSGVNAGCDFSWGQTSGIRVEVDRGNPYTVRAVVKAASEAPAEASAASADEWVLWTLGLVVALMSNDKSKARCAYAETREPQTRTRLAKRHPMRACMSRFVNMAVDDYERRTMNSQKSVVPSLARNASMSLPPAGWS